MYRTVLYTAAAMLIAASTLPARSSGRVDASTALVKEARQTLRDIERTAVDVASAADRAEAMSQQTGLNWQSHTISLNQIKSDMNFIGREVKKLEAEQESLAPWEREALVRTVPLLKDAADNTEHAIEFLNANMSHVWLNGTLHDCAANIAKDSGQVRDTLRTYIKLDNAIRQAKEARDQLSMQRRS